MPADDGRHVTIAVQGGAKAEINMVDGDEPPPDPDRIDAAPALQRVQGAAHAQEIVRGTSGRWSSRASCAR
jgi:hypothetical protein